MTGIDYVIKLGGDVLEGAPLHALVGSIAALVRTAAQTENSCPRGVIVHGGGSQVTDLSGRLGLSTRMVAGRRITDAATLDVMKMVVAGRLNVDLCAALQAGGVAAVGLHAGSGCIRAHRRPPRLTAGAGDVPIDFGLVGDVASFDLALLQTLAASVTNPAPGVTSEEVLYSWWTRPPEVTNSHSSLIEGPVLTAAEMSTLACYIRAVELHFRGRLDPRNENPWFAMESEFKLVGPERKPILKQARPYSFGRADIPVDCREF
jgi:hypothetical protein